MARDPGRKCAQSTSLPPGVSGQMSPAKTDPQRVPFGREFGWQREDRVNVFGRERVQTAESFLKQRDLTNLTRGAETDRKSTRLNSSHVAISYAVFCLKKKNKN